MMLRWTTVVVAITAYFLFFAPVSRSSVRAEAPASVVSGEARARTAVTDSAALSERTISVALAVDRDGVRLLGYAVKNRPYDRAEDAAFLAPGAPGPETAQIEIALVGPDGGRFTRRVEVRGLCLDHGPEADPHVEGDTIRLHHESLVVDFPEVAGNQLRVRFGTSDDPSDSLTEAAIDEFEVRAILCASANGDYDNSGRIDLADFDQMALCLRGPAVPFPQPNCAVFDFDGDGNLDGFDFAAFQNRFGSSVGP